MGESIGDWKEENVNILLFKIGIGRSVTNGDVGVNAGSTEKCNRNNRDWISPWLPLKVVFASSYVFYGWARDGDVGDTALCPILTKASQQEIIVDMSPGVKRYVRAVETRDSGGAVESTWHTVGRIKSCQTIVWVRGEWWTSSQMLTCLLVGLSVESTEEYKRLRMEKRELGAKTLSLYTLCPPDLVTYD